MFTQTLLRRGVINIPLFKPAYTPVTSDIPTTNFRANGFYPQLNGGVFWTAAFPTTVSVGRWLNGIPLIAGLSDIDFLGSGSGGQGHPLYVKTQAGGYSCQLLANDGSNNGFVYMPQAATPGAYGIADVSSAIDTTFTGLPSIGPASPFQGMLFYDEFGNGPFPGYMTDDNAFGPAQLTGHIADLSFPGGKKIDCMTLPYLFTGGLSTVNYYQVPYNGINYGFLDAALGNIIPRQIASYQSRVYTGGAPGPLANYNVVFDDATLESCWNGTLLGSSGYRVDVWAGGWIIILDCLGNGPTKQAYEVAVCAPDMSSYNLLNFVAQDPGAVPALHRVGAGFGWQVKIDPDGILWFNSGNGADGGSLWFSYSPPLWPYPQFSFTPGAFRLPCYTTCYPFSPEFQGA